MDAETKNKIITLENKVRDLENKLNSIFSLSNFPIELENILIQRGFQNVGDKELILYYDGGAGGNLFTEIYRTVRFRNQYIYQLFEKGIKAFTPNATDNKCYSTNHGFVDGQYVNFRTTDTLPAGLDSLVSTYWIINATANTFQVTTDGVNPVDITSAGVGEQYAFTF